MAHPSPCPLIHVYEGLMHFLSGGRLRLGGGGWHRRHCGVVRGGADQAPAPVRGPVKIYKAWVRSVSW